MKEEDNLDVGVFYGAPRHAFHFATNEAARAKIASRFAELRRSGRLAGKTPIVNIQTVPDLVELHDGNASVIAWLLFAAVERITPSLRALRKSFDQVIILHDRRHDNGEIWHPFVPIEVRTAAQLQKVVDIEQGREACKAITLDNEPVFFNDQRYFAGEDSAELLRTMARRFG